MTVSLSIIDWLLFFLYATVIFFSFTLWWRNKEDLFIRRKQKALLIKFVGVILFVLLHIYLFKVGDTFYYWDAGVKLGHIIYSQPAEFMTLLTHTDASPYVNAHLAVPQEFFMVPSNFMIVKLVAVIAPLCGQSFLTATLLFGLFSFFGTQSLLRVLEPFLQLPSQLLDLAFVYIPTLILWSSGIGKDSITFGAFCFLIAGSIRVFIQHQRLVQSLWWILMGYYLCLIIKSYILYASLPFFLFFLWHQYYTRPYRKSFKIIGISVNAFLLALVIYYNQEVMTWGESNVLSIFQERFLNGAKGLSVLEAGSNYDLGIDYFHISGITQLFQYAPRSIMLSLFRPYPTDIRNANMILNALESLLLLLLTLWVILRTRLYFFKSLIKEPFLLFCVFYCLTFSFFIGLASGNFGTLVRYKIPMLPFFILVLLTIYHRFRSSRSLEKESTPNP